MFTEVLSRTRMYKAPAAHIRLHGVTTQSLGLFEVTTATFLSAFYTEKVRYTELGVLSRHGSDLS